jgi:hypothetical protein
MARDFEFLESTYEAPAAPTAEELRELKARYEARLALRLQTVSSGAEVRTRRTGTEERKLAPPKPQIH